MVPESGCCHSQNLHSPAGRIVHLARPASRGGLGPWKLNRTPRWLAPATRCGFLTLRVPLGLAWITPRNLLRKEVIQPQVPLRLPCYDFTPVTVHSLGACLPC